MLTARCLYAMGSEGAEGIYGPTGPNQNLGKALLTAQENTI